MATPFFALQSVDMPIVVGAPGSIFIPTVDASGAAIDVSSGYTMTRFDSRPQSDPNTLSTVAYPAISSNCTIAFGATGVTISWTEAQSLLLTHIFDTLRNVAALTISNDSGTTHSLLASINISVDNMLALAN